ncbi:MAG: hypothetical protein JOZ46_12690 [Candidatus Dormibacteraeota bacterium]|nr:hypothetical protein [Candidatus Dormibacteraeota bacterium]MBV9526659.1 hypothetical protein [Candidatus Dormibacteraeota bacterium]
MAGRATLPHGRRQREQRAVRRRAAVSAVTHGSACQLRSERVSPDGISHPGYLDHTLNPPRGLSVVTCDATARIDFARTPLAWGVFWSPTIHAHAEALPPPFRQ